MSGRSLQLPSALDNGEGGRALFGIALYRYDSEISQVMDIIDQLINSDDAMESFLSLSG